MSLGDQDFAGRLNRQYGRFLALGLALLALRRCNRKVSNTERAGFLSSVTGCLPISFSVTSEFTVTQWVVASGGNLRGSSSYRLGDTTGQPAASGTGAFTSANYVLSSGFWANVTGTVPIHPPIPRRAFRPPRNPAALGSTSTMGRYTPTIRA